MNALISKFAETAPAAVCIRHNSQTKEENKMNKEIIINALDNCIGSNPCKNCPYETGYLNFPACAVALMKDALKLIRELESVDK